MAQKRSSGWYVQGHKISVFYFYIVGGVISQCLGQKKSGGAQAHGAHCTIGVASLYFFMHWFIRTLSLLSIRKSNERLWYQSHPVIF